MIHDVDESLRELAKRDVLNGARVEISFEAPNKDWAARRNTPTLNFYLYDIREDLTRREVQFEEIRNEFGRVVDRRKPPRLFKLSYLVTAWTQRPEDEHRLLSAALGCFIRSDALPADILQGALADLSRPVRVTCALPLGSDRSISDVWSAMGGELKPSLDLVVTAPFAVGLTQTVGPPVLEELRLTVVAPGAREQRGGRHRASVEEAEAGIGAGAEAVAGGGSAAGPPSAPAKPKPAPHKGRGPSAS
jgi:hypothetical protein